MRQLVKYILRLWFQTKSKIIWDWKAKKLLVSKCEEPEILPAQNHLYFLIFNPFDINFKCVFCMTNQVKDFQAAWILILFTYIPDNCMINVLSICHTVNVFLWKIKHETLKPWNFQLTKLVTEHRFAQRSLKCETLKNGDFVAEITPSRSMIEFHLHSRKNRGEWFWIRYL